MSILSLALKKYFMTSIIDQTWFSNIIRPSRYLGNEINAVKKDYSSVEVSVALAFPDVYEVGISHLGLKILYNILNNEPWLAAERVFCPWIDLEKKLRDQKIPLMTLESSRPMASFDVVGFSLQHELCYTNVLNMLNMAGIPLYSKKRGENDPLIIAGGPSCFNPEPISDFIDLMVIGDGEAVTLEICRYIQQGKKEKGYNKKGLLSQLCRIKGVYIPSYFHVHYKPDGIIENIEPLETGYSVVEKALLPNIDEVPSPDKQIVPFTEAVHDRLVMEIARGCTRGCRFCQAGMIYRPVRERDPDLIMESVQKALALTGYEELSLLSLSSGDYTCIEPLLKALMDRQFASRVAVSLPSLRIDSLDPMIMDQIKRVRKTGFTLAPEAGNERLRKIINKGLTQDDILNMAQAIYGAGWNLIKFYFMIGLPFEDDDDIKDIIQLAKKALAMAPKKGKLRTLNLSASTFVPKSHTPFMWLPMISLEESQRRIRMLIEGLRRTHIRVKWNQPEISWLEGIFARGDRRLGKVLFRAWQAGAKYDSWGEHFNMRIWKDAFTSTGIDPSFYLYRQRNLDEIFPWEHIKSGVTKEFLKMEWQKAEDAVLTPDCRTHCISCGVCDHKTIDPVLVDRTHLMAGIDSGAGVDLNQTGKRYRLVFTKLEQARFLGHLELMRMFIRAFKRADVKMVYSRGYHPKPKLSFTCALPVGTSSEEETLEIEISSTPNLLSLKDHINLQLPTGIRIKSIFELPLHRKKSRLIESTFMINMPGVDINPDTVIRFGDIDSFPVKKVGKKGEHIIDICLLVKSLKFEPPDRIMLVLKHIDGPQLKPAEIIKHVFSISNSEMGALQITKIAQVIS